ncbi:YdeI/OmpD-associated family protein [Flagellimonas myxillae]|uniref:YdeI/OmpD-associated family protein n=1 Tax=Flagellimonas myxillae TaxID=2942214 RepID=UPI00201F221E|nr:YdeI/OmpD-associated family protein [Muricauda myxillae]MCL6265518.1 YdeI/OmpD-associated family protein [Muricauda myxillae]
MKSPIFEATLHGMHSFSVPEEICAPFEKKGHKRVRVRIVFEDRSVAYNAALQKRQDQRFIMLNKKNQQALGIFPNDYFQVQLFEDNSKYGVEMPEEFNAVLTSDGEAQQIFEALTDGKKRGIIYAISRYKTSQTRIDKSLIICENLKRGIRDTKELLKQF